MSYIRGLREALKIIESCDSLPMAVDLLSAAIEEESFTNPESQSLVETSKKKVKNVFSGGEESVFSGASSKIASATAKIAASAIKQEAASQLRKAIRGSLKNLIKK
jgi:hypothetical protein